MSEMSEMREIREMRRTGGKNQVMIQAEQKMFEAVSEWAACRMEEDEEIAGTLDSITGLCRGKDEEEVLSLLGNIIGRAADITAELLLRNVG